MIDVYGIGNPLIDIICQVSDEDLRTLGLDKGIMRLVDLEERAKILAHIEGKKIVYRCGGSCPNTLIFLAALGKQCTLAGKIADDEEGRMYAAHLPERHLTSHLIVEPEGATGTSIILVSPDTERTMNTYLGVNRLFSRSDLDEATLAKTRFLYITGYMWDTDKQKEAVLRAARIVKTHGGKIVFDLADPFAVNRNREEFRSLIEDEMNIVFANAEEASLLFGSSDAKSAVRELSSRCELAVVKDGSAGSYVMRNGEAPELIPVRKISAVDTTGAGDMYAAGFLYGLLSGFTDREAGVCASYLASRIVETFGAQFTPEERKCVAAEVHEGRWKFAG